MPLIEDLLYAWLNRPQHRQAVDHVGHEAIDVRKLEQSMNSLDGVAEVEER